MQPVFQMLGFGGHWITPKYSMLTTEYFSCLGDFFLEKHWIKLEQSIYSRYRLELSKYLHTRRQLCS